MLDNMPLSVILSWPKANTVNPESRGPANLIITIIFFCVSIPAVCLRLYIRHFVKHSVGWDDLLCVVALIFGIAFGICAVYIDLVMHITRHMWDIPIKGLESGFKLIASMKLLFQLACWAIRQSLLCFYLRMIRNANIRWFKWTVTITMAVNAVATVVLGTLIMVHCIPFDAYWKFPSILYGKCIDDGAVTVAGAAISAFLDFVVLILPIPIIARLQMSKRTKIGVIFCLCLGLAASSVAVARTYYTWRNFYGTNDASWAIFPLLITANMEIHIALFCCCAPAICPWIVKKLPWTAAILIWVKNTSERSPRATGLDREPRPSPVSSKTLSSAAGSEETYLSYANPKILPTVRSEELAPVDGHRPAPVPYGRNGARPPTKQTDGDLEDLDDDFSPGGSYRSVHRPRPAVYASAPRSRRENAASAWPHISAV